MTSAGNPRNRRWIWIAVLTVFGAFGIFAMAGCANGLFYWPNSEVYGTAADCGIGVGVENVTFAALDGPELHGWWLPAKGESKGTVVYCHGNHANLGLHARYVKWLPARGGAGSRCYPSSYLC